jgi:hypothetical protein
MKAPQVGEIVLTRWPDSSTGLPGKARLTVVTSVRRTQSGYALNVAYGTSRHKGDLQPGDFLVDPDVDGYHLFRKTGLQVPTKFSLSSIRELPFNQTWFKVPCDKPFGESPKIGKLPDELFRKVASAIDTLKASRFGVPCDHF